MKKFLLFILGIISMTSFAQDGSPDLSFGNNGVIVTEIHEGDNWINGIVQDSDDRIFVTGYNNDLSEYTNFIMAYFEDGSIDNSFGDNGVLWTNGNNESYKGIKSLPDNNLLLISSIGANYTIKRLLQNGTLDSTFGNMGLLQPFTTGIYGSSTALDSDNNLMVLGIDATANNPTIIIKKFSPNGNLDISFGNNGTISHSFDHISSLTTASFVLKNDKIFIGLRFIENNLRSNNIFRLMSNGDIDTTFGNNGVVTIPIEEEYYTYFSIFQEGSFLVGGSYWDENTESIIRKTIKLLPDGSLNQGFGNNGFIEGFAGGYIQENQRFIANRDYIDFEGGVDIFFSRFFPNGNMDDSFQFTSNYSELASYDFTPLHNGKFLIVGTDIWYNGPEIRVVLQKFNNTSLSIPENPIINFNVSPNPSSGIFTLEYDFLNSETSYQISDITGKVIQTGILKPNKTEIDLSSAQSGMYFLKSGNSSLKLLKK